MRILAKILSLPIERFEKIVRKETGPNDVLLHEKGFDYGEMPEQEKRMLCRMAIAQNPDVIFEIGTFLGSTTLDLALNTCASIYTLDLPVGSYATNMESAVSAELDVFPENVGEKFHGTDCVRRITQLYGHSQYYDYTEYSSSVDFVFVDASHHYENVLVDSYQAFNLIRDNGLIVWHDYADYAPDVVKVLDIIAEHVTLYRIEGTSLVFYRHSFGDSALSNTDEGEIDFVRKNLQSVFHSCR